MTRRQAVLTTPFDRRTFLRAAGAGAAGLMLPAWLPGCGDGGGGGSTGEVEIPLTVDPSIPWWLQNNFEPVFDEIQAFDLPVAGAIPPELNGVYVRNGSNPQSGDSPHWFMGDGMLHGVRLENGRAAAYRNRYVRTPLFAAGTDYRDGVVPIGGNNQSNVSPVHHAGRLLTSGEVGFPYEIKPSILSTVGVYDFAGALDTSFTAHPKIDPATGHLHFFGYGVIAPPYLTYFVADETGAVIHREVIEVGRTTMIHSFAITERDVIFWELPVVIDLQTAVTGEWPFYWEPSYGARIGVMPLGGPASAIRWVEIEPCYVFHELNAFRDGDQIVIDVCRYPFMMDGERFGDLPLQLYRWRIDTSGESLEFQDEVLEDRLLEFPTHDRRFTGRPNRFGWFVEARRHPDTIDLRGIFARDQQSGELSHWNPGPNLHCGEAFFVPGGAGEGQGWLLTLVYDRAANTSKLVILDATRVPRGPVAVVELPRRVPYGFHGVWVPD
jgi:carotenoid cleavage dioxygenase